MVAIDRAWCKLQPGCFVDPEGNIRLPNQVPPSIRSTISDEEIKKGKKGQKNIFCIRACAGTDHERVLHLRSQSTSNMVEWVNNINAVVRLLHHKKASMDTNRMHQRVSVMFDVLMHQEDEESLSEAQDSFDDVFMSPASNKSSPSATSSRSNRNREGSSSGRRKKKGMKSNRQSYFPQKNIQVKPSAENSTDSDKSQNLNSILDELENLDMGVGAGKVKSPDLSRSTSGTKGPPISGNSDDDAPVIPSGGGCCVIS